MIENAVKNRWNAGEEALGLWLGAADPRTAEMLGSLPYHYINVDLQHGLNDYDTMLATFQALRWSNAMPFVRVPWNEPGVIGRVLDAGAMGVIIPMVNSVAEAADAVAFCRYPPAGRRSFGPIRAGSALGGRYYQESNGQVAVIPMIETVEALEAIDDILAVDGIDAVYVGPSDLALSLGLGPGNDHPEPVFVEAIDRILAACERHGVIAGIHSQPDVVDLRRSQGFKMITVTSDTAALMDGAARALDVAGTPPVY
ncbi:MAG: aldolase/citrate lyase family protein [Acidimicrobiales bacterium]